MSFKQNALRGLALSIAALTIGATTVSSAAELDRRMVIINNTNHAIVSLFASRVGDPQYHEDHLGSATVLPGQSVTVDLNDGSGACSMDVKAVFSDGDKVERGSVNVCTGTELRYTGN